MIDHAGFAVSDIVRSRGFYEAALEPLGFSLVMTATPEQTESGGTALGFGQFTAATGGDLGWAGIYDNVADRLAFYDDLADLTGPAAAVVTVSSPDDE